MSFPASLLHPQIEGFNQEEEAFGWPITQYPNRKKVQERLTPFLRLYETAADFQNHHHQWVHGPLSAVNPDKVEGDVGSYWRALYKLEKNFQETPKALHITTRVKAEVEAFKENIPIVQVVLTNDKQVYSLDCPVFLDIDRRCMENHTFLPIYLLRHTGTVQGLK